MKRIILFFSFTLFFVSMSHAQTDVKEGLVYSESGFIYKSGTFKVGKIKYRYGGLYMPDGKTLVKGDVFFGMYYAERTAVAPGTEVIMPYAFSGAIYNGLQEHAYNGEYVVIPSSVKYLSPLSFNGFFRVSVYDDTKAVDMKSDQE